MTQTEMIKDELSRRFAAAQRAGHTSITVLAKDLHDSVAAHWNYKNRMPNVCRVMWAYKRSQDEVVFSTESGQSTTLKIRYKLPR